MPAYNEDQIKSWLEVVCQIIESCPEIYTMKQILLRKLPNYVHINE